MALDGEKKANRESIWCLLPPSGMNTACNVQHLEKQTCIRTLIKRPVFYCNAVCLFYSLKLFLVLCYRKQCYCLFHNQLQCRSQIVNKQK